MKSRAASLSVVMLLLAVTMSTVPAKAQERAVFLRQQPWKDVPRDRALKAGFLVIDGVYNTELTAPYDILQHTIFHTEPGIEVFTVSPDGEPVRTFEGLRITPDHSFESAPEIDILVVPSAEHNMDTDLDDETLIKWVLTTGFNSNQSYNHAQEFRLA